jgi:hypothetical protein
MGCDWLSVADRYQDTKTTLLDERMHRTEILLAEMRWNKHRKQPIEESIE